MAEGGQENSLACRMRSGDVDARTRRCYTARMDEPKASAPDAARTTGRGHHHGVYLPLPMREEMDREAARLQRGLSYLARLAWTLARDRIRRMPAAPPEQET